MSRISISLISHNQRHDLERLLPSSMPAAYLANAEVLLVDNTGEDDTSEFVRKWYPDVSILTPLNRAGYGENHNRNLDRAKGQYFLIMNSDMLIIENDFLIKLNEYMNNHPDVGIVTVKILNEDGSIQGLNKRYPTLFDLFLRRFAPDFVKRMFKVRLDHYEMRDVGYDSECDVEFISGAFMFCRTEVLKSVGGFDSGYFLYFEDVDLCRRVQATHRTVYYPEVSVIHFWERASHKKWNFTKYFIQSAFRYFSRWGYKIA